MKQELANAQNTLSGLEKQVQTLQKEIEQINNEKLRLQIYKNNKGKQVAHFKEIIKNQKDSAESFSMLNQYIDRNNKIKELLSSEFNAGKQFLKSNQAYIQEIKDLKGKLDDLRAKKSQVFEDLALARDEIDSKTRKND